MRIIESELFPETGSSKQSVGFMHFWYLRDPQVTYSQIDFKEHTDVTGRVNMADLIVYLGRKAIPIAKRPDDNLRWLPLRISNNCNTSAYLLGPAFVVINENYVEGDVMAPKDIVTILAETTEMIMSAAKKLKLPLEELIVAVPAT
jgi:hypothetical protein